VTEEQPPTRSEEDLIDLGGYFAILRKDWWKIALFSLAVGIVTLLVMFLLPDIYQATAVLTPAVDEKRPNPAWGSLPRSVSMSETRPRWKTWKPSSRATTSPCACSGNTTCGRSLLRTNSIPRRGR